ncbi:MAG: FHA domain-containing protein [Chloroflexaceae bacterium]|nr:FHA domain-containing protein [Chloroflexaceae bacterium]
MSALNRFEQLMEHMVEGSVARFFRSPVQPAEIAKRLERAMESNQMISVNRVIVPNVYRAFLNPQDFSVFQPYQKKLEQDMAVYLTELAEERNFTLLEHPRVQLGEDPGVPRRSIQVLAETASQGNAPNGTTQMMSATMIQNQPQPRNHAHLLLQTPDGPQLMPVETTTSTIGRGLSNDMILEDTRVSRRHAQLRYKNRRFWLADLGSTNGTFVNGERVSEAALRDGDQISLGGLELTFREG